MLNINIKILKTHQTNTDWLYIPAKIALKKYFCKFQQYKYL